MERGTIVRGEDTTRPRNFLGGNVDREYSLRLELIITSLVVSVTNAHTA